VSSSAPPKSAIASSLFEKVGGHLSAELREGKWNKTVV
jgi:hypothetical protein